MSGCSFKYRVRRSDKRTYWQFGDEKHAVSYMLSKVGAGYSERPMLATEAYLCKLNPDGSEGEIVGWFTPAAGGGVTYSAVTP